jgi:hypothetical protein
MPNGRFCAAKKYFVCFVCNDVTICVLLCARKFTVCPTITDGGRHGYTMHCTSQGFSSLLFSSLRTDRDADTGASDRTAGSSSRIGLASMRFVDQ